MFKSSHSTVSPRVKPEVSLLSAQFSVMLISASNADLDPDPNRIRTKRWKLLSEQLVVLTFCRQSWHCRTQQSWGQGCPDPCKPASTLYQTQSETHEAESQPGTHSGTNQALSQTAKRTIRSSVSTGTALTRPHIHSRTVCSDVHW